MVMRLSNVAAQAEGARLVTHGIRDIARRYDESAARAAKRIAVALAALGDVQPAWALRQLHRWEKEGIPSGKDRARLARAIELAEGPIRGGEVEEDSRIAER